jgi:hypothetical protein
MLYKHHNDALMAIVYPHMNLYRHYYDTLWVLNWHYDYVVQPRITLFGSY